MKKLLILFLINLFQLSLSAQKEGNVWFFGGGDPTYPDSPFYKSCTLDFNSGNAVLEYVPHVLPFTRSNSSICDKDGNFLCLSNGENIYNRNHEIMEGGGDFYPNVDYFTGMLFFQSFIILPMPGDSNKVVHVYGNIKIIYPPDNPLGALGYWLRYAIVDMAANDGLGKVTAKHLTAGTDTLGPGYMTATRHGNGRDWWILINHYREKKFYRFLLDPTGIKAMGSQNIEMKPLGLTQAVFSPDGKWMARFSLHGILPDSTFSTIELYPFDRCTGLLGDIQEKTYSTNPLDGKPGGVAFSASSRYMYVSRWDTIFQYDMQAPNIFDSEQVVAVYDGFWGEFGTDSLPQRFYSLLLGPDEKIYGCVSNYSSRYLHVINKPEEAGVACDVQQHAIHLPVFNEYAIPNNPYYGLGKWVGSPCDTIGVVEVTTPGVMDGLQIFPNPADDFISVCSKQQTLEDYSISIFDVGGRLVQHIDQPGNTFTYHIQTDLYPNGLYWVELTYKQFHQTYKVSVIH